jgi:hypothetical protein
MNHGSEALIRFVGAERDALELLELAEEVFDQVTNERGNWAMLPLVAYRVGPHGVHTSSCLDSRHGEAGRAPHGSPILIHATAEESGGALGMWETLVPPGKGPAPHIHTREAEVFRVITGRFGSSAAMMSSRAAPGRW